MAVIEDVVTLLIRVSDTMAKGGFNGRWTLQQALDASRGLPAASKNAPGQKEDDALHCGAATERLGLLLTTVNVAANVTNALHSSRLGRLVLSTAAQVRPVARAVHPAPLSCTCHY